MCSCGIGASAHTPSSQTPACRSRPSRSTGGPYQVDFWSLGEKKGEQREETADMSVEDVVSHDEASDLIMIS